MAYRDDRHRPSRHSGGADAVGEGDGSGPGDEADGTGGAGDGDRDAGRDGGRLVPGVPGAGRARRAPAGGLAGRRRLAWYGTGVSAALLIVTLGPPGRAGGLAGMTSTATRAAAAPVAAAAVIPAAV